MMQRSKESRPYAACFRNGEESFSGGTPVALMVDLASLVR